MAMKKTKSLYVYFHECIWNSLVLWPFCLLCVNKFYYMSLSLWLLVQFSSVSSFIVALNIVSWGSLSCQNHQSNTILPSVHARGLCWYFDKWCNSSLHYHLASRDFFDWTGIWEATLRNVNATLSDLSQPRLNEKVWICECISHTFFNFYTSSSSSSSSPSSLS